MSETDKIDRENQNTFYFQKLSFFLGKSCLNEIILENVVVPGRPQIDMAHVFCTLDT
jgi:hypothetical protein